MTDLNAAVVLLLKDKFSGPMRKTVTAVKVLKQQLDTMKRSGNFLAAEVLRVQALRREIQRLKGSLAQVRATAGGLFKRGLFGGASFVAANSFIAAMAFRTLMGPAIEMENFRTQLEMLEGSAAGGKRAMSWISDFAQRTPLELAQVMDAYAKLKNSGIDPTDGSLQAMVDTMALSGKGAETLDRIILASGQAWQKHKLSGEEAMQFIEAGVPVWDILAKKTGKTTDQLMKMASAGKLTQKYIKLLFEGMAERSAGASDRMSKQWGGIVSNIGDAWYQFRVAIADSGPFQDFKNNLQGILDTIKRMQADGSLQKLATDIGGNITEAIKRAAWAAKGMWRAGIMMSHAIKRLAEIAGGYENLGYLATSLFAVGKAWAFLKAVGQAGLVVNNILTLAGASGSMLGLAAALVAAAGGVYYFRNQIGQMAGVSGNTAFAAIYQMPGMFLGVAASASWAANAVKRLGHWLAGPGWDEFKRKGEDTAAWAMAIGGRMKAAIVNGLGSLFDVGAQWIGSLWQGIKAKAAELMAGLSSIAAQAKAALSFGGPVSTQNYSGSQMGPAPAVPSSSPGGGGGWGADGARALGGSVYPGKSYLVGEHGPEMIMPKRYGHVVPMGKGGGGRNITVHMGGITINGNADQNALAKLAQMLTEKLRAGLHDGAYA